MQYYPVNVDTYNAVLGLAILCIPPAIIVVLTALFSSGEVGKKVVDSIAVYGLVVSIILTAFVSLMVVVALFMVGVVVIRLSYRGPAYTRLPPPPPAKKPREKSSPPVFGGISSPVDRSERE